MATARRLTLITAVLLLIPAVAMCITDEVNWNQGDFFAAALLIAGTGLACTMASRLVHGGLLRVLAVTSIVLIMAGVWVNLAVDVFDTLP